MPKFLANIDLVKNQITNVTLHNNSGAPSSPTKGQIYYDTGTDRAYINVGTTGSPNWVDITTAAGGLNSFGQVSDGTNTAAADSTNDVLTLTSANSLLSVVATAASDTITFTVNQGNIDHGSIGGLGDDDHSQYALLAGRSGGQTLIGGTGSGNDLTLTSTSHSTKGNVIVATSTFSTTGAILGPYTGPNQGVNKITTSVGIGGGSGGANIILIDGSSINSGSTNPAIRFNNTDEPSVPFQILGNGTIISESSITGTQFLSTTLTGDGPPMEVASTERVDNLNSDMVDDFHASQTPTADTIVVADSSGKIAAGWIDSSTVDHGGLTGLSDDDHTQYARLAGRSGGQTLLGGTANGNNLVLNSTSGTTKGSIIIGNQSGPAILSINEATGVISASQQFVGTTITGSTTATPPFTATVSVTTTAPMSTNATGLVTNFNADRLDSAHASATPTASTIPIADGSNKLASGWISGVLAASDLTNGTTGSGSIVLATSPTIVTPTIASFANANHNHQNSAGGGQLDHGLALTGLGDDDHTQYVLLAGRSGGQTINGGTGASDSLILVGTSNGSPTTGNAVIFNAIKHHSFTRAIPTTNNATIEIGGFTPTNATAEVEITIVMTSGSYPIVKRYILPIIAGATAGAFQKAIPVYETGASGGNDFDLELSVANTTAATVFRLRRTGGSTVGNAVVSLRIFGTTSDAFTASTTTSTSSVTAMYAYTGFRQYNGTIDFSGDNVNMGVGSATTGGGTLNMAGGSITNANNITATGTITAATFSGAFSGTFAAGTQSAPSITFTSRTDVGFYSPAANTVAIVSNNTEFVRVNSTGIGFFAATPVAKQGATVDLRQALINYGLYTTGGASPLDLNGGLLTAANVNVSAAAGAVTFTGGTSGTITASQGGVPITVVTPSGGPSGAIALTTGAGTGGNSGNITLTTGNSSSNTAGDVILNAGSSNSGSSNVRIQHNGTNRIQANSTGLGFFGVTPVAQQGNTVSLETVLSNLGFRASGTSAPLAIAQLTIADGSNVVLGTTTGTKIGTATTQKIGFFNATPVVQPSNTTDIKDALIALGLLASGGATNLDTDGGNLYGVLLTPTASTDSTTALAITGSPRTTGSTTGGAITISGGAHTTGASGTGGAVNINGGSASGATSTGGSVTIKPGTGTSTNGTLSLQNAGATNLIQINSTGMGFFGATPVAQQGNTVSLETVLSNLGLRASGTSAPLAIAQLTIADGSNVVLGTTTGTRIGTATNQKIGFFNATPVVQQSGEIAAALVALGLMSSATALTITGNIQAAAATLTGNLNMSNSGQIINLVDPTNPQDAATKNYVDTMSQGLDFKQSVRVATAQRVGLDGTTPSYNATGGTSTRGQITWATGPTVIDGVTLANGNRMLLKNEADSGGLGGAANGIWVRTSANTWDRATDFDSNAEVTSGAFDFVEEGTANDNTGWVLSNANPIVIGGSSSPTALVWVQFSGAGTYTAGSGLTLSSGAFSVNTNTTLGTTITSNNVVLTGQALALHQLGTNGVIVRTGSGTVAARTIVGTTNRLSVSNGDGVSNNPTLDIDAAYVGQTSITTLGTITTGTWNGTTIAISKGGTGATTVTGASGAKENLNFAYRAATTITGDGTTTSFTFTHNYSSTNGFTNTRDLEVVVRETTGNYEVVYPDVRINNDNSVTIVFGIAPANLVTYRVIVQG